MSEFGRFEMVPAGPFEAGAFVTVTFTVTLGKAGLRRGGCVKICPPNQGWGRPYCAAPAGWEELLVGTEREHNPWKPINTRLSVRSDGEAVVRLSAGERSIHPGMMGQLDGVWIDPEVQWMHKSWRWWITVTVERGELAPGDVLTIVYGDTADEPAGVRVQPWPEDHWCWFGALIDHDGSRTFRCLEGAPVEVQVTAGPPERMIVAAPSVVRPGEDVPVRVSVVDRNLCELNEEYDGLIEVVGQVEAVGGESAGASSGALPVEPPRPVLEDRVQFGRGQSTRGSGEPLGTVPSGGKAPVGGAVPSVSSFRIEVRGPEVRLSNPAIVDDDPTFNIYWGDLHAQSIYHQWDRRRQWGGSCQRPRELHQYARDVSMLDFVAITDAFGANDGNDGWDETQRAAVDLYEPGRYVPMKGWECGMGEQGDKCVVYRGAEVTGYVPAMRASEKHPSAAHALIDFYRNHRERVLTIPHSFMKYLDWTVTDPELDRVMEVYSTWGAYDSRSDNPLNNKRRPVSQSGWHAWNRGLLLGVTAAGDSHVGRPGRSVWYGDRNWCQCYKAGLCAVVAPELTREAVWDALYDRRCYGTTGERIVLRFSVNGRAMGSVVEYDQGDPGLLERTVRVQAVGTDLIRRVDLLKNNVLLHRDCPGCETSGFEVVDRLDEAPSVRDRYVVRLVQADGNAAWASPVWVGPRGVEAPAPSEVE